MIRRLPVSILASSLLASFLSAQVPDDRGDATHLWYPTGTGASVALSSNAVIGQTMVIRVKGTFFSLLHFSTAGTTGLPFQLMNTKLLWYLDLSRLLAVIPTSFGTVDVSFPIPNNQALVGLDLAFQSLTFTFPTRQVGASDLLLINIGRTTMSQGLARYSPPSFQAVLQPQKGYVDALGKSHAIHHMGLSALTQRFYFFGTKSPNTGPLELRTADNGGGQLLTSIPASTTTFDITPPRLPPSTHVWLWNADKSNPMTVKWGFGLQL